MERLQVEVVKVVLQVVMNVQMELLVRPAPQDMGSTQIIFAIILVPPQHT